MRICKVCECGKILLYEPPFEECPDPCPNCGRMTLDYIPYREDDSYVRSLQLQYMENGRRETEPPASEMPEPPASGMPEPPISGMPEPPMGGMPEPPASGMPEPPMGGMPEPPMGGMPEPPISGMPEPPISDIIMAPRKVRLVYILRSIRNNYEISLGDSECSVGRTAVGAEQLANNNAVSREHIIVKPNKRQRGVYITDVSRFGTKVNGNPIIKGTPVFVMAGSRITLYNEELVLEVKEITE